jgi:primosomal protein N' (replication factor Y) (superfamily II helicase)
MKFFGTGLQKIQEYIGGAFPGVATITIDATTVSSLPKISRVSQELGGGQFAAWSSVPQCVIATSLLQVPPRDWKPDAVIVIRADSSLGVPDWKVAEHAYSMLTATIAAYHCPIIVQSYNVEHHAIRAACAQKPEMFWAKETAFREAHGYPPHGELAVILYKHEIEKTMFTRVNKLYQELLFCAERDGWKGEVFATPPLVYKVYDKYRYHIVLQGTDVRDLLDKVFVELRMRERGFKVDRMPEGLLG